MFLFLGRYKYCFWDPETHGKPGSSGNFVNWGETWKTQRNLSTFLKISNRPYCTNVNYFAGCTLILMLVNTFCFGSKSKIFAVISRCV